MRRYASTLIFIVVLAVLAGIALGFQTLRVGDFERGDDTLLGLTLGLDLQGGSHLVYQVEQAKLPTNPTTGETVQPTKDQMDALLSIIERRVNSAGLGEPILQLLGEDRLLIQLPGIRDPGRAKALIGETASLVFKHRILEVEKEIPGLTSDAVISFQIGAILPTAPTDDAGLPPFRPGDSKTAIPLVPEPEPTPDAEATPSSEATPAADATPAAGETPAAGATPSSDETPSADTTPTAEAEATPTPEVDESTVIPTMLLELEPEAAQQLLDLIDRLQLSLIAAPGGVAIYPDFLGIAVEGETDQPALVSGQPLASLGDGTFFVVPGLPLILNVPDTDKFLIILGNAALPVEDVMERFTEDSVLVFTELDGAVDDDIGLTGEDLARAYPGQHQTSGLPIVNIEFNSEGTRKFGEITSEIAGTGDLLAIFLDDEELIAPRVNQPITRGVAFIEGQDFTFERVSEISLLLEGGRLPVDILLIQERDIDAILGADSLAKSVVAGLVGLALVLAFMVVYYRVPGLVAALALVIYAALLLAVFKMLPVTLTLSGVAAVILSIGMAVDANILIFERMKEELRAGRTLLSAINIGFNRAWPAIRDGNVSTLITCAILFWFADTLGATVVQGFAITLAIGVLISMFTAIVVSRTFLRLMAATAVARKLVVFVPGGSSDLPRQQAAQPE